ncbi:MAG: DUF4386 family protein [Anaerolineales bacterium]|nr:DUF4386 family protein [Anaerolineales bacterium]
MNSTRNPDIDHRVLCTLGGAAAWVAAGLVLGEAAVFAVFPQPDEIGDWFRLLQEKPLVGWLDLWGLELPLYAAFLFLFLALYAVLRKTDPQWMKIALAAGLIGIGVFFATNNPAAVISLSRQHAAAATETDRSALLAAGRALLAATGQRAVGGFNTGLGLVSVAGLIVSCVMIGSQVFGKPTAYLGIVAHALSLADFLRAALTDSDIAVLILVAPNALLLVIWYVAVGRTLLKTTDRRKGSTARHP